MLDIAHDYLGPFVKDNLSNFLLCPVFFFLGALLIAGTRPDHQGVYLKVGDFMFGRTEIEIQEVDLAELDDDRKNQLAAKIKALSVDDSLGFNLRRMATQSHGPFGFISVNIELHLDRDQPRDFASVCGGSAIFHSPLYLNRRSATGQRDRLLGLRVSQTKVVSECQTQEDVINPDRTYKVWANHDQVLEWLEQPSFEQSSLTSAAKLGLSML